MGLEKILSKGKELFVIGLASTVFALAPGCGGGSGGGGSSGGGTPNRAPNAFAQLYSVNPSNQYHSNYVHPGNTVTYLWSFDSKPALSSLTDNDILNRNSAYPSFVPDVQDTSVPYTLKLVVSDGRGLSDNAYFSILAINNSPPVANAGNILGVPKNITFSIDATNSSDIYDGVITQYELDLEGDGTYEASNTSGTFNILGGYPLDICLYSTIKLRDDDNAQDIAIDCIPVGIGVCPDPCP